MPVAARMSDELTLKTLMNDADVVLDCTDNLASRQLISRCALELGKPLVFGAALRFSGQVAVFDFRSPDSPCYRCLFEEDAPENDQKALDYGVFTPITGVVGLLQASEALKIAAGIGSPLVGRLLMIDLLSADFQTVRFKKAPRLSRLRQNARTAENNARARECERQTHRRRADQCDAKACRFGDGSPYTKQS